MKKYLLLPLVALSINAFADEIELRPMMDDQHCKAGIPCSFTAKFDTYINNTSDHTKHYKLAYQMWPHVHNGKTEKEEFDIAPGQEFIRHYEMTMGYTFSYPRTTVQVYQYAESDTRQMQQFNGHVYTD